MEGIFGFDSNTGLRTVNKDALNNYIDQRSSSVNALDYATTTKKLESQQASVDLKKEDLMN